MCEINKTQRILSIYHLLANCEEVSMKELKDALPGSKKTFMRDIALLKKAGVRVRYSAKRQAYVLDGRPLDPARLPESPAESRFIKKIIRLVTFMDGAPPDDCDIWYIEATGVSKRTMQRDFAVLTSIGYTVVYERDKWNIHDAGIDVPPGRYYCDRPYDTFSLDTFKRGYVI